MAADPTRRLVLTASALALPAVRAALRIEVVGVIGPGARAAVKNVPADRPRSQFIGVIATESTVQSGAYTRAIKKADPATEVIERACPLFVPLAEEGWADNEVARTIAEACGPSGRGGGERSGIRFDAKKVFLAGWAAADDAEASSADESAGLLVG